ncbi:MAG: class I SAM-dependent methyltransferase [Corallococcus sp.]|nr:class I SAM-dependent methyltransferase [Corallococcus sp.]MCM1359322.1 class I SAM-dependent methyltransferase [Corallococcus sp.]MCM1394765.1 class I SAM-dependent methyltransferase [Corallococcus sp.]
MKSILDVACGGKMFYFDKNDTRVLFCDKRRMQTTLCDGRPFEIKPDVVVDFTALPFADNTFKLVVFDPPHLLHNETSPITGYQQIKYGALQGDWKEMLTKGFAECFRVLEANGVLIFKWNETDVPVSEILRLTNEKPIFGHKSGKRSNTHWICFMKGNNETGTI